jgi:hypothetical protein
MPAPDFKPLDAAPIYERAIPRVALGRAWMVAVVVLLVAFGAWEWKWRAWGAEPTYRNSNASWAMQRRRIDTGDGHKTVLLGASRVLFDVQLPAWERVLGERPIQLAVEGTTPLPMLEDLAENANFTGRVLIGVAPDVFFTGFGYREGVLKHFRKETPTQRAGHWLSLHFVEPFFAFYDDDFKLFTVLKRQKWPSRSGVPDFTDVRKLSMQEPDRNTTMWSKVETDAEYRALCQHVWAQFFNVPLPGMETPEALAKVTKEQIERTAAAVAKLRARGIPVLFLRAPADGAYLAYENREFPRAATWDPLLAQAAAGGIHFEDHPELQGYDLPEWSHLSASEAVRFTEALCGLIRRDHPAWLVSRQELR